MSSERQSKLSRTRSVRRSLILFKVFLVEEGFPLVFFALLRLLLSVLPFFLFHKQGTEDNMTNKT